MRACSLPPAPAAARTPSLRHGGRAVASARPPQHLQTDANQSAQTTRRRLLACSCAACSASAARAAEGPRSSLLDASFAQAMATGMADYERSIASLKHQLFGELLGGLAARRDGGGEPAQLLELGVGTGPNLPFYAEFYGLAGAGDQAAGSGAAGGATAGPGGAAGGAAAATSGAAAAGPTAPPPLHITGLDRNAYMRPYLDDSLARSGWPAERFTWVQGDVAALPLGDASVDAVVCTLVRAWAAFLCVGVPVACTPGAQFLLLPSDALPHAPLCLRSNRRRRPPPPSALPRPQVLCSVPDVERVLAEAARVLKPGGSLLFIEHTSAALQARLVGRLPSGACCAAPHCTTPAPCAAQPF